MTNNQLTKEWLQNRIADMESTRDDIPFGFDESGNNELAAFKLALAAMDSEPVVPIWGATKYPVSRPAPGAKLVVWDDTGKFVGYGSAVDTRESGVAIQMSDGRRFDSNHDLRWQYALQPVPVVHSEPVAWTDAEELNDLKRDGYAAMLSLARKDCEHADPRRQILLFTHPAPESELKAIVERLNVSGYECGDGPVTTRNAAAVVDILLQQLDDAVQGRNAQPAPVVPDDVLDALQKVARIRLDLNDFDGDRRGIAFCLSDAEETLIEVVNRRAAMLQAGNSPVIPDGYMMVPMRLTAENGAKAALLGEFNLEYTLTCHECFGEGCDDCSGEGTWTSTMPIDWTTIKEIWDKAINHFAAAQREVK